MKFALCVVLTTSISFTVSFVTVAWTPRLVDVVLATLAFVAVLGGGVLSVLVMRSWRPVGAAIILSSSAVSELWGQYLPYGLGVGGLTDRDYSGGDHQGVLIPLVNTPISLIEGFIAGFILGLVTMMTAHVMAGRRIAPVRPDKRLL